MNSFAPIAKAADAAIVIGGKENGYLGRYPGVVEEALCAIQESTPLYVVGALGGCARSIFSALHKTKKWPTGNAFQVGVPKVKAIADGETPTTFLEYYNHKVADEDQHLRARNSELKKAFFGQATKTMSLLRNGLTAAENEQLGETTELRETIHFVIKGLMNVKREKMKQEGSNRAHG